MHLIAAAAEPEEIQFALIFAQRTIEAFLDTVGQILGDVLLEATQEERTELGGKAAAGNVAIGLGILATLGFIGIEELILGAEVAGLDEIHDAPEDQAGGFPAGCRA